jgi:TolB protein
MGLANQIFTLPKVSMMDRRLNSNLLGILTLLVFIFGWTGSALGQRGPTSSGGPEVDEPPPVSRGIDIDVRVGARRVLLPLAVPDTLQPAGDTQGAAASVQEILRRNLDLAGFFKVLPTDSFFFDPSREGMGAGEINFQNWFNVGAQGLIKSAVRLQGDQVVVDLRLYSVEQGTQVRLNWSGSAASRAELRGQVNTFINAVIEHYTGTRGIFGSRILYAQRDSSGLKQVFVMDMDGSNRSQITRNRAINLLPTWGPGGAVFYTSYQDQNPDLWMFRGGEHTKLSSRRGQNTGASYCRGNVALTLSMGGENADIYTIDPSDGKIVRRLTDHWAIDTTPSWSPDCSKIAFVSGRSGGPQIYVMNADGSGQRRLTHQGTYNTGPSWSPRGDVIAFSARDERNRYDIFTVDLEGNIERLTQDQGNNEAPSFSPDGRYIVFSSDRGAQGKRLWMMTADGEIQRLLTPDGVGYSEPAWSR